VKVYRLPRITYERAGKSHPFKNDESEAKAGDKRGVSLGNSAPNNEVMNNEQPHQRASDESITLGTSTPSVSSNKGSSGSSNFTERKHHHHQSQSARKHIKWPEYATWCESQKGKLAKGGRVHDGRPTEKGFSTWLSGQKPEWRNKQSQVDGYELDGKFLTPVEAREIALANPKLLEEDRFRQARKMQCSDGAWWVEDMSRNTLFGYMSEKR
jgi:hypothetical protein